MRRGRAIGLALLALLLLSGLSLWLARGSVAAWLAERGAERQLARDLLATLPDGLTIGFCGTGSPMPDPDRAGPCTAVIVGSGAAARLFVVDVGEAAPRRLALMGIPAGRTSAVLITHFHSDHIDGLGGFALQRWVGAGAAARGPLPLVGPSGVEAIAAGLNAAYAADARHRLDHHGPSVMAPEAFGLVAQPFAPPADRAVVRDEDGLRITAIRVDHDPVRPAVGYRFDYKGRCVTLSGDTARSATLEAAARGCDLLVHEALQPALTRRLGRAAGRSGNAALAKIMADIEDYHSTPAAAAETAAGAGVRALAFTHIVPPLRLPGLEQAFLAGVPGSFTGKYWIARDGDLVLLPVEGGLERRRAGRSA